ncbi:hypothetical protein GALMADRAFT_1161005 [Galerina marginata CBS 339.88]|uniref:Uncharacterized protein n=1 Tax=Galerina marginata (strain CBS 339.88) TaxID=685588 RepID=A0A067S5X7_GALM3|nr:hypothetical protein GALMADRAFT_1161005 [Galerina marginata CBS 339.88]
MLQSALLVSSGCRRLSILLEVTLISPVHQSTSAKLSLHITSTYLMLVQNLSTFRSAVSENSAVWKLLTSTSRRNAGRDSYPHFLNVSSSCFDSPFARCNSRPPTPQSDSHRCFFRVFFKHILLWCTSSSWTGR